MIEITIYQNEEKEMKQIQVKGHASFAELGAPDHVCAGISAVTQLNLMYLEQQGQIHSEDIEQAHGLLIVNNLKSVQKEYRHVLRALDYGLREVAKVYPKNITITTIRLIKGEAGVHYPVDVSNEKIKESEKNHV